MIGPRERFAYRRNLGLYLRELSMLSGRNVTRAELSPVEDVVCHRASAMARLNANNVTTFTIPFDEKRAAAFAKYIDSLYAANRAPVYVWTHRTEVCGAFLLGSVRQLDTSFDFEINEEGIVNLLAADFADELMLAFWDAAGDY